MIAGGRINAGCLRISTWLHRVAVNVVLVDIRSQQRREFRIRTTDDLELHDSASHHTPAGLSIDLEHAMTVLPQQAQAVFVLHDIEGYKHEEIAEQLGVAVGTCKAQLHRTRTMLKEVLERGESPRSTRTPQRLA